MELIGLIVAMAVATGICVHLFIVSPIIRSLLLYAPDSFGARHSTLVPIVTFFLSCLFFPFMLLIIASNTLSNTFIESFKASLEQEEKI